MGLKKRRRRRNGSRLPGANGRQVDMLNNTTEGEIDRLLSICQPDDLRNRVHSAFFGGAEFSRQSCEQSPLMAGLELDCLEGFLEERSIRLVGRLSYETESFGSDYVCPPRFHSFELGPEERLKLPIETDQFLEGPGYRMIISSGDIRDGQIRLRALMSDEASGEAFLLDWSKYTRTHNRLRGRAIRPDGTSVTDGGRTYDWSEVYLPRDCVRMIKEQLDYFQRDPAEMARLGIRRRRGLLLHGLPGTGKTLVGKILASTLDLSFIWCTPGDLARQDVRGVVDLADFLAPCLLYFEDLEILAEDRASNPNGALLGELMNLLDGCAGDRELLVLASTNRLEVLEKALRNRPGRFDRVIEIPPPDEAARRRFFRDRLGEHDIAPEHLELLVRRADGATGAEIEEQINSLLLRALGMYEGEAPEQLRLTREMIEQALEDVPGSSSGRSAGF